MPTHVGPVQVDSGEMSFEACLEAYDGVHAERVEGRVQVLSPGGVPRMGALNVREVISGPRRTRSSGVDASGPVGGEQGNGG